MMSSAIPARLQFQCGHAAMVTLPRVKGESAAQRNDRIAQEKSAALSRLCDFCAPAVVTAVNGNGHFVADLPDAEPIVALAVDLAEPEPEPEVDVVVVLAESELPVLENVEETVEASVAEEELELVVAAAEEALVEEILAEELAAVEAAVEAAEVVEAVQAVEEVVQELVALVAEAPEAPVAEPVDGEASIPARAVRRRATRKPRAEEVARGRRFLVEYRVERVLQAVDIHDALRQASTLGAAQVTAITREG